MMWNDRSCERTPTGRRPHPSMGRLVSTLAVAAVGFVCVTGCQDGTARKQKTTTSAIWIGNNSEEPAQSTLARLKDAGVEEAYVPAARFEPDADEILESLRLPSVDTSLPLTLAVRGSWSESSEDTAAELGSRVAEAAKQLRFDVESRGALVVGIHLDFIRVDPSTFSAYAAFLRHLNKGLSEDLFFSISLHRAWIGEEGLAAVVDAVDYVVPFLYGQRVNEADSGEAWDFVQLESRLRSLETLDVPYQIGVVTLGTASWIDSGGTLKARTTRRSMVELLQNADFRLRPGFSFDDANRRVYIMGAEQKTTVDDWQLGAGDTIRMVRIATSDLEELMRLTDVWGLPNHLGQLFYRLPSEQEGLSLASESLLLAFDPAPAVPEIDFEVSVLRRTGRGWLVRVSVVSKNREFTELAVLDNNFVQVKAEGTAFNRNVRVGDFARYEIFKAGEDGSLGTARRNPDVLRLFLPILEGEQKAQTGNIEVMGSADPVLTLEASFLLPDGQTLKVGPRYWKDGNFVDEAAGS